MHIQTLAWVFAIIFLVIGILGFVPGITSNGHLLGIFEVDALHNIIHLASGVLAAVAASMSAMYSRLYFQAFGIIYALVTVAGFVQGNSVLGIIAVNFADNVLHLVIAAIAIYIGFGMREQASATTRMQPEERPQQNPSPGAGPGEPMV